MKVLTVYGGAPYDPQERGLRNGVHIVIGTPGRLLDHMQRGNISLAHTSVVIIDEADKMLEMGFQDDVDMIMSGVASEEEEDVSDRQKKKKKQVLLFSATIPSWVRSISKKYLSADVVHVDLVQGEEESASTSVRHIALPCQTSNLASCIADVISVYARKTGGEAGST